MADPNQGTSGGGGNDKGMAPPARPNTRLSEATVTPGGVLPFPAAPNRDGNPRSDQQVPFRVGGGPAK